MERKRAEVWGQVKEKAFRMYQWVLKSRVALLALVGIVSLTILVPVTADAFKFLGCDWFIEGNCLVGDCEWFGFQFRISICLV